VDTIKGVSRQAVVMKMPADSPFEEAIFLVRAGAKPIREQDLLRQARSAVGEIPSAPLWHKWAAFVCGAGCVGLAWLLVTLL